MTRILPPIAHGLVLTNNPRGLTEDWYGAVSDSDIPLLAGEDDGLAFDFTSHTSPATVGDCQVKDTGTPANDFRGAPLDLVTYTSPTVKQTLQANGNLLFNPHQLYLNPTSPATQSITVVSGFEYKIAVTGSGSLTASNAFTGSATEASALTGTAATTTLTLTLSGSLDTAHVFRTPAVETFLDGGGSAAYQLPYEWDTSGSSLGILVEAARTNVCLWPEEIDDALHAAEWVDQSVDVTSDDTTAPDGETTADKIFDKVTASVTHLMQQSFTKDAASETWTFTIFAKQAEYSGAVLQFADAGASDQVQAGYDLDAGTVSVAASSSGSFSSPVASIEAYPNDWYRLRLTGTTNTDAAMRIAIYLSNDDGTTITYNGDGSSGIYFFGAQLEEGSFPTSYIKTASASVTRAADDITLAISATPLPGMDTSGDELSIYAKAQTDNASTSFVCHYERDSGREVDIRLVSSTSLSFNVDSGGAANGLTSFGSLPADAERAIAGRYAEDDMALSLNGETQDTDSSVSLLTAAADTIRIGHSSTTAAHLNGHLKELAFVPRGKTNAELEADVGN